MAKRKTLVIPFKAPPAIPDLEPVAGDEPVIVVEKVYAFPTKSRCPKCGRLSTRVHKTDREAGIQYRSCRMPSCQGGKDRGRYKVPGTPI